MALFPPDCAVNEISFPGILQQGAIDGGDAKAVHRIQEWCSLHGQACAIDGDFGPATARALQNFQTASHLPATGELDDATWMALTAPMRNCLIPNTASSAETLLDVVVRTARRHLAQRPLEVGGDNCGPWVRLYMRGNDGAPWEWCAGFACFILLQANAAKGGALCPIPYEVGVDQLVADAKSDDRFIAGGSPAPPGLTPGCLFVVRGKNGGWVHTGIVTEVDATTVQTIEGNTNEDSSSNGYEVAARVRVYKNLDFVAVR